MAQNDVMPSASNYPENLGEQTFWNCNLQAYRERLRIESGRLFGNEAIANVGVLELIQGRDGFGEKQAQTEEGLLQLLSDYADNRATLRCQHFFIRAKSSQTKLYITESMIKILLSHFQVMPTFLDFLFTFGKQQFKKNFHFSGFRAKELWADQPLTVLSTSLTAWPSQFQLCYNLRCVESTPNPPEWPWSIRQTAVFHSFDLRTGDMVWINIKGSADISPRFKRLARSLAPSDLALVNSQAPSFKVALATHLVYCEWSGENWAAYVGFLEDQLQAKTRYALLATVSHPKRLDPPRSPPERIVTAPPPPVRSSSWAQAGRASLSKFINIMNPRRSAVEQPSNHQDLELPVREQAVEDHAENEDFSYDDLRRIQYIEDQANVALLVIRSNVNILGNLKGYYNTLHTSTEFQMTLGNECDTPLQRFTAKVTAVVNDLELQQSRVETLLRLLADRKSLLLQLFAHRNMSATKHLTERAQISAEKSQISAEKMESLTEHMTSIALKTEKETIFMRIITVVTLFFLPGTFVATLMSTDIVKFQNNGDLIHQFSWMAFVVYLAVTLPIMLITFLAASWYRRRVTRLTAQKRAEANKAETEQRLLVDV